MNGFIGHFDMQRVFIGIGINSDRGNAHFARSLNDPAGDFTTVGYENFFEHITGHPLDGFQNLQEK